jgi:hypothetical protein
MDITDNPPDACSRSDGQYANWRAEKAPERQILESLILLLLEKGRQIAPDLPRSVYRCVRSGRLRRTREAKQLPKLEYRLKAAWIGSRIATDNNE